MSWLSAVLGGIGIGPDSESSKAQGNQRRQGEQQLDFFKDMFADQGAKREDQFNSGIGSLNSSLTSSRGKLSEEMVGARGRLKDLFTSQRGQFQGMLGDVQDAGRQQASRTGLIGGGQEGSIVNPAVQRLGESFGTMASQAQLGLEKQGLQLGTALDSQGIGLRNALHMQQIGATDSLQQMTHLGMSNTMTSQLNNSGKFSGDLLGDVAGIIGAIFGGKKNE